VAIRTLRERIVIQQRFSILQKSEGDNFIAERLRGSIDAASRDLALLQEIIERL
jgi:hypothetical protein